MNLPMLSIDQQFKLNRHVTTVVRRAWMDTSTIKVLELADPGGWDLPRFSPGAHVDMVLGDELTRQYSLCGDSENQKTYLVAIHRHPNSRGGSRFIHDEVREGAIVSLSLPRNLFPLASEARKHIFIAGGIGITPFMSMIPTLLRSQTPFHLHVCTRNREHTPFLDRLDELAKQGMVSFYHNEVPVPNTLDMRTLLQIQPTGAHAYFCGPAAMLEQFHETTAHWEAGTVHFERFGAPIVDSKAYTIYAAKSGRRLEVNAGEPMSAALKRNGLPIRTSCEAGICGMCKTRYLVGEVEHHDHCLSDVDRQTVLTPCVSICKSAEIQLDI